MRNPFRIQQILLWILFVTCVGGLISIYYLGSSKSIRQPLETFQGRYPGPRHSIQGFSFEENIDGRKILSIKADRLTIQKKKLGFFRFGLMNEVRFENALVQLHGNVRLPGNNPEDSAIRGNGQQDLKFDDVFSDEAIPSFPIKRISAIVAEPVAVELHGEHSVVTRITAASAAIRLPNRGIFFRGNVRVASGPRRLTTDQLTVFPHQGVMKANGHSLLETADKQWEGNRLTTDILLSSVTPDGRSLYSEKVRFEKGPNSN